VRLMDVWGRTEQDCKSGVDGGVGRRHAFVD
jgi:hypothetical protein